MKIVFHPNLSDLEEKSVSHKGKHVVLKREVPTEVPDELGDALIKQQPENFQAAE